MSNREYKVITSNTPAFSNNGKLQQILAEEAQAGWELEEKFDNFKIRVSRDKSARDNDGNLDIDPYRTNIGMNNFVYMGSAAVITLIVIFAIIQLAAVSV